VPFGKLMPVVSPTSPAKAPVFAIVIHEKGGAERREAFESAEISLGRVQGNDLMLPKGNVSKRHARLLYRDGRFIVTDLNSTNGTYVNRRRITQATIVREGDRIYIGDFVLRIELPSPVVEQSVAQAVPSAAPGNRALLPSAADSQPSSSLRSSTDEEEEQTRSASRGPRSSPVAASAEIAQQVQIARTTQTDEDSMQRAAQAELVALLVERVSRALPLGQLELDPDTEQTARSDQLLRDAWIALGNERPGTLQLPADRILAAARAELFDLGPLGELLAEPSVTDIAVIGFDRIAVNRSGGRTALADVGFSCEAALRWAVARLCLRSGAPLGASNQAERRLPDGTSISAVLSPLGASVLSVRRPRRLGSTLDELVRRGTVSRAIASFLTQCLLARLNLLVVGPRDGGTEMLLGALATAVPEGEVVYAGNFVPAQHRGGQRLTLDGTPDEAALSVGVAARAPLLRLVVELGEPHVSEAVLSAIADGGDGVIAARSAGSMRRALLRLKADLGARHEAQALIMGAFEVVIEIARLRDDRHRVLRIAEVITTSTGELELSDIFTFVIDRTAAGGLIEGSFLPAASLPVIVETIRSRGAPVDTSLFVRPASR